MLTILGVFFLFFIIKVYADTIYLKNGNSLEGLVSKEEKDNVEVNVGNGAVVLKANEIERIDRSTPQEVVEIKKSWEINKGQSEKTKAQDRAEKERASEKWNAMVKEEISRGEERRDIDANTKIVQAASDKKGHLFVNAVVNEDVHASLIVDTGCPVVLLTASMGRKLGIDLENISDVYEVMVLDGKHKVRGVLLKSVKLGDLEEKNIRAEVLLEDSQEIKHGLKDGLLGMSFLKRFDVTLDQKKMKLFFKPHP